MRFVFTAALVLCGAVFLSVTDAGAAEATRVISVSGEGSVSGTPDQARLSAGVVTQAATAAAALAANSAAMNKVFATLKAAGIPDTKIRTSNFSVQPQYPPYRNDMPQPHVIIAYQVSNQVTVIVDDLAKVGPTLDALVKSGANDINDIAFAIADPKPLTEKARVAAVSDAMAKAKTLAQAAGVTLGSLQAIEEGSVVRPAGPVVFAARFAAAAPTPIAAGEENVTVNVTMTYAIQ